MTVNYRNFLAGEGNERLHGWGLWKKSTTQKSKSENP